LSPLLIISKCPEETGSIIQHRRAKFQKQEWSMQNFIFNSPNLPFDKQLTEH
jgi:hypothetical protein